MSRFVDTNVFIYSLTNHPRYGETARKILGRIEKGEDALTSTLVLCEVSWVLEAMGKQGQIKQTLEKVLSYRSLRIGEFDVDDLIVGANYMRLFKIDFNDGINVSVMTRLGVGEAYSNDKKHLGRVDFVKLIFRVTAATHGWRTPEPRNGFKMV